MIARTCACGGDVAWLTDDDTPLCERCCLRVLGAPVTTIEKRRDNDDAERVIVRAERYR